MTCLAVALAVSLLASPLVAARHVGPAPIGAGLQVVSGEPAPAATTDDALFGPSDCGSAARSPVPVDALTR